MIKILITLQVAALAALARLEAPHKDDERGSVTVEQVLWAVAATVFAGVVVAAIKAFIDGKIPLIK